MSFEKDIENARELIRQVDKLGRRQVDTGELYPPELRLIESLEKAVRQAEQWKEATK